MNGDLFNEHCFVFHMLLHKLFICADPIVQFGRPLFECWLKACSMENVSLLFSALFFSMLLTVVNPVLLESCLNVLIVICVRNCFKTLIFVNPHLRCTEKLNTNCWEKWLGGLKIDYCFALFLV